MADTTQALRSGESVYNAIVPLDSVLDGMIVNYNSAQRRKWERDFAADVVKAVAEERGDDFGELHGSIEEALGVTKLFPAISKVAEEGGEYLASAGVDPFLAGQIADEAAKKIPSPDQRGGKQVHHDDYVEFEAVSYYKSGQGEEKTQCFPLGARIRYKTGTEQNIGELSIWNSETGAYEAIPHEKPFFVGNLLPIEIENGDDSVFVYYTVRLAITKLPWEAAEETPVHEKPAERRPTQVDLQAADLFASFAAGGGTASEEQQKSALEKVMAGQNGGNGTNGAAKNGRRLVDPKSAESRILMNMHRPTGGGVAHAPQ